MDHSLKGYLSRRTTQELLLLLENYWDIENEFDMHILQLICDILQERNVDYSL